MRERPQHSGRTEPLEMRSDRLARISGGLWTLPKERALDFTQGGLGKHSRVLSRR